MITRVAAVRPSTPRTSLLNCITPALDVMMSWSVGPRAGEAVRNKNWRIVIVVSVLIVIGKKV